MPKFNYVALDAKGKEQTGSMEAENSNAVVAKLRGNGLFPTNVSEVANGGPRP